MTRILLFFLLFAEYLQAQWDTLNFHGPSILQSYHTPAGSAQIPLPGLAAGVYSVRLEIGKRSGVKLVVVE